ncbi:sensor histidine kinase [Umezawaea tangerina]|uniref:Oxygen sensor histidine kinase NreB n=1 Tax=Umezawaea tangerina TaxID=84725 RepID=A0A2T0SVH4_9PSEU|nr:sensor histidine kinase [Umezawaea tangerina]PRY37415.1 signal transduction histidine kinase [Umezawaea tangerina]
MRLFRVSVLVYAVVLLAGLYYAVAGLSPDADPLRLAGFVAGIGVLVAVESLGGRHVVALLALRLALYVAVAALDESGLSRVLFVLVPFTAYLQLGRRVGLALGGVSLVLLLGGYLLWMPGWYTDATSVSDVLMFCVGLVLALSMAAIATREREARARATELSAAVERTRLARDIHDGLGHHLTAIAVQLEKAEAFRDLDPAAADRAVADARRSARLALRDVRSSVRAMRSDTDPFDLPSALADLVRDTGIGLTVVGEHTAADRASLATLYRAAQESLTNARRHAHATTVSATLTFGDREARLEVVDDGRGFDPDQPEGFGLRGMRERAELVGGRVEVASRPGAGTRVTVTVPS